MTVGALLAYNKWVGGGLVTVFMVLFGISFHWELEHRRSFKARAVILGIFLLAALAVTALIFVFIHPD